MNCPKCNSPGAYVGLVEVECPSYKCSHYRAQPPRPDAESPGWGHLPDLAQHTFPVGVTTFVVGYHNNTPYVVGQSPQDPFPTLGPWLGLNHGWGHRRFVDWMGWCRWRVVIPGSRNIKLSPGRYLHVKVPERPGNWITFSETPHTGSPDPKNPGRIEVRSPHSCTFTLAYYTGTSESR